MIIDTLITDRSQADVAYIEELSKKGWSSFTEEEQFYWLYGETEPLSATDGNLYATDGLLTVSNGVVKGAYNANDLNRVSKACLYLYKKINQMGSSVSGFVKPKMDWASDDIPTLAQMQIYLNNVAALKSQWSAVQTIPQSMSGINHKDANNIEKLLIEVDNQIKRMYAALIRCGIITAFCGTGYYFQN